jgi:hypothetical protein
MVMPVVRGAGERRFAWNLNWGAAQVDSVLSADGWRPVRRNQSIRPSGPLSLSSSGSQGTARNHFPLSSFFSMLATTGS